MLSPERLLLLLPLVPVWLSLCCFQGGHFAVLEQPQLLYDDLMAFVDKLKLS